MRRTHGRGADQNGTYVIWKNMRKRCANPNTPQYKDYGGRGISVCSRWDSFENFVADVGERPYQEATLERKNNNGNYEPANCVWATRTEQRRNARHAHAHMFEGKTYTTSELAAMLGITDTAVRYRIARHGVDAAMRRPVSQIRVHAGKTSAATPGSKERMLAAREHRKSNFNSDDGAAYESWKKANLTK